jgi:hypothetical protein
MLFLAPMLAGVSSIVGPTVNVVNTLSHAHAVAGTHAVVGVSVVAGPTVDGVRAS